MKSSVVSVRLESDLQERFSVEAQAQKMPLAAYLRRRLEREDHLEGEFAALRHAVEASLVASTAPRPDPPAFPAGTLVEILLLLRSLAGPQNATLAQKEVERRGLETWR